MSSVSLINGHIDDDIPRMTPQEAIEFIKNEVQIDVRFCSKEEITKTEEAFEFAVSALEKHIPKKPIEDGYYAEPSVCPNCGSCVINETDHDYQFEHCYHCGQALDWGGICNGKHI